MLPRLSRRRLHPPKLSTEARVGADGMMGKRWKRLEKRIQRERERDGTPKLSLEGSLGLGNDVRWEGKVRMAQKKGGSMGIPLCHHQSIPAVIP